MTNWPKLLRHLSVTEQRWSVDHPDPPGPGCVPWMPYPMAQFVMYLTDAVREASGTRFLDVGGGPGTKAILAARLFGLDPGEIELDPVMAAEAAQLGVKVEVADALDYTGYDQYDIVYVNRPVVGAKLLQLQQHIMDLMRPGGVLIDVNGMRKPSSLGWLIVAEEFDSYDGVWLKPAGAPVGFPA